MSSRPAHVAVILAGGVGTRVGMDIPKQLIKIAGRTILEHTLATVHAHPDAAAIASQYVRHGSMLSFRVAGASEDQTRHLADVLATTTIVRYALSFDGLATKVNHHKTVSEYFTPPNELKRNGFDRLIRLAVGLEDADDLIAALNWTLHHGAAMSVEQVKEWQQLRMESLGVK